MSKVLVSKRFVRAFPGGTGEAKTAANYAQSLSALDFAYSKGYQQVLYLDAMTHSQFEELGGMNFFWVKNGELYTPRLNGQILHGVTRRSIIEIASQLGYKTHEDVLTLDDLRKGHADGSITEAFATGTAAAVAPLGEIGIEKDDKSIESLVFSSSVVAEQLREYLVNTHFGKTPHSEKWLTTC